MGWVDRGGVGRHRGHVGGGCRDVTCEDAAYDDIVCLGSTAIGRRQSEAHGGIGLDPRDDGCLTRQS